MKKPLIVLASASPRRRQLLRKLGVRFKTAEIRFRESVPRTAPEEAALLLAWRKLLAARKRIRRGTIVTADTIVSLNGRIYGKPGSRREAVTMLRRLAGATHEVITALAMHDPGSRLSFLDFERTYVTMRPLSRSEIRGYADSGEPYDKAGAYGIQGLGGTLISRIDGDYFNVVGLPVKLLSLLAESAGIRISRSKLRSLYCQRRGLRPGKTGKSVHFS